MNKFKVGDKVVLKKNLVDGQMYGGLHFYIEMLEFKRPRVIEIADGDGTYKVKGSRYWFTEDMLEFAPTKSSRRSTVKEIADWLEDTGYLNTTQLEEYYQKFMK